MPRALTPKWFVSGLIINPSTSVVILDDDDMIHKVWHNRFRNKSSLSVIDFYAVDNLFNWYQNHSHKPLLFLIDYELIGSNQTGLEVIEQLAIESCSYLVTNHYEDFLVQNYCARLGIRLIPKIFVNYIPITILTKKLWKPMLLKK